MKIATSFMSKLEWLPSAWRIRLSQMAVGIVLFLNIQCAVQFLVSPSTFSGSFELTGIPGENAVRGIGILFLMWNVPYIFAFIHPVKYRISYLQAVLMQSIGLAGESLLQISLSAEQAVIQTSLTRFIVFDGVGLGLLVIGFLLIPRSRRVE